MKKIMFGLLILFVPAALFADVPFKINFQGRFSSTGTYSGNLIFKIVDISSVQVGSWSETYSNPDFGAAGVYNVVLGDQTEISTSIFTGTDVIRSLEIDLGGTKTYAPLVTVPFAYRSFYTDELAGGATVQGTLNISGALSADSLDTGQGAYELYAMDQNVRTTDSVVFDTATLTGNAFSVGTSTLVVKDGNIGLGESSPGATLELKSKDTTVQPALSIRSNSTHGFDFDHEQTATGRLDLYAVKQGTRYHSMSIMRNSGQEGYVGIGTTAPGEKLHVYGSGETKIKIEATSSGSAHLVLKGYNSSPIHVYNHGTNGDLRFYYTVSDDKFIFDSAGNAYKPNGGTWSSLSDQRLKKNITPVTGALDKIIQLEGVRFEWINPEAHSNQIQEAGFIAQDVEKVFPSWVRSRPVEGPDKSLVPLGEAKSMFLPFEFHAYLVGSIKELKAENDELKRRLSVLEAVVQP